MSDRTGIEWTDATWNPTRGCSRVSEGCRNCYAERIAARFSKPGETFHGFAKVIAPRDSLDRVGGRRNGWTGRVELIPSKLTEPLRWKKPRRVFVNSMSDLFHESLKDEDIDKVFAVMSQAKEHTFQVLTKRPERMRRYVGAIAREDLIDRLDDAAAEIGMCHANVWGWPLPNVWLGVSVENQATADERIPLLLQTPAAVRWVSYEPALGPVEFRGRIQACEDCDPCLAGRPDQCAVGGFPVSALHPEGVSWVVVGGESGPGARPFDLAWARSTVAQCKAAGVPVFVKQLGRDPGFTGADGPGSHSPIRLKLANNKGGDISEWPEDIRIREFPA